MQVAFHHNSPSCWEGRRWFTTGQSCLVQHKTEQAEQFSGKDFHPAADKVDAKAQVIFETCWRRLENKLSQVSIPYLLFLLVLNSP